MFYKHICPSNWQCVSLVSVRPRGDIPVLGNVADPEEVLPGTGLTAETLKNLRHMGGPLIKMMFSFGNLTGTKVSNVPLSCHFFRGHSGNLTGTPLYLDMIYSCDVSER